MAKSIDDTKKEVEELSEVANDSIREFGVSIDSYSRVLSALIIAQSFNDLADAIREAGKEIADAL